MALRLIEIYNPEGKADEIHFLLKDLPILDTWHDHLDDNQSVTKVLIRTENTEAVLDLIQGFFTKGNPSRVVILSVEATLPRPEEPETEEQEKAEPEKSPARISIEELYQKLSAVSAISKKYIVMTALASFVASIGLLKDDVAVIIGSMVIAPLLNPNMALSLATTLADYRFALKAVVTNIAGFLIVLLVSITMGMFMNVNPDIPQIASRANVSHFYIFVALATGVAGAYSITAGVAEALVGVMVAVALLPPLAAAGLLFGSAHWHSAFGALLLCLVNIVCINLSGVITFTLQGIRPKNWWDAGRARRATAISVLLWFILLLILVVLILLSQKG